MKIRNADYQKTFSKQSLTDNKLIVTEPQSNLNSSMDYLENLIWDVVEKRKLSEKRIVIFAESIMLQEALIESLLYREVIEKHGSKKFHVKGTSNELAVSYPNFDFDDFFAEHFYDYDAGQEHANDTFIFTEFGQLMEGNQEFWKKAREKFTKTIWLGLGRPNKLNNGENERYGAIGNEDILFLPNPPHSFSGFIDSRVSDGIKQILESFRDDENATQFSHLLECDIFSSDKDSYTFEVGTGEYLDLEEDFEEKNEVAGFKPFLVSIELSKYGIEVSIELQDFDWDGTAYMSYEMNFENDIVETCKLNNLEKMIDIICSQVREKTDGIATTLT